MFFKEQAWIFVQLIIFKAPLPIFVSSYLSKKQSICMLISVYKIFKSKISFKCCCQCTLQLLRTLKVVDIKYLSECHFSYNYHNHGENHSHTRGFFNLVSKQKKNKNENMEQHGTFTPFKSHLYSKSGSSVFLLFGSWSLVLYLYVFRFFQ